MADGDDAASAAALGGVQVAAAPGEGGSHEAQTPGGETSRTYPFVNAELQLQQFTGPPRQGAQSTSLASLAGRFDGSNWFLWKSRVLPKLMRFRLLSVVTGTEVAPVPGDAGYEVWADKEVIAYNELISCLSDSVLDGVRTSATSHEIWRKLVAKYESVSLWKKVQVKFDLNVRLADGGDIEKHVMKFKQSLELLLATSKYGWEEEEKVTQLLYTLPPSYQVFITALLKRATYFLRHCKSKQ